MVTLKKVLTKDCIYFFQGDIDQPLIQDITFDLYVFLVVIHKPGVEF